MSWSIQEVARMAKVTSRTLRHYDAIGLLPAARTSANGYREYDREQLLRLQQVLLLRELGLGLGLIGEVLAGTTDEAAALRRHHAALVAEGERLRRLADTVARTLATYETGVDMPAEQLFDGFSDRTAQLEEDLVARHGDGVREHFARSREAARGMTREDLAAVQQQWADLDDRLAALVEAGVAPDDPRTFEVLDDHHAAVSRFWTPDAAAYTGLGELYVQDEGFRARYDGRSPGLAAFLRDAMAAYAAARLA